MEVSTDKTKLLVDKQQNNGNQGKKLYLAIIVVCCCVIITLLMLNLWQAGYLESSESEVNIIECSGNGHKFTDFNECECYPCYNGTNCEYQVSDCMISAGSGNPRLFVEFWAEQTRKNKIKPLSIPMDYRLPYNNFLGPFSESDENSLSGKLNQLIRRVHAKYRNVNMTNSYLVFGAGATHLQTATFTAQSTLKEKQIIAVDEIPYYFGYTDSCTAAGPSRCVFNAT